MTDIGGLDPALLAKLGFQEAPTQERKTQLGQSDFLRLLSTQIENQDPLNPLDNTEFVAQMAQFGILDSVQGLESSFTSFGNTMQSSFALQASALVGRKVMVDGNVSMLSSSNPTISGLVGLTNNVDSLSVEIVNGSGSVVKQINLGPQSQGSTQFTWDGKLEDGTPASEGLYSIRARGVANNVTQGYSTAVVANVDSVTIGKTSEGIDGLTLNLAGIGPASLDQVKEIK